MGLLQSGADEARRWQQRKAHAGRRRGEHVLQDVNNSALLLNDHKASLRMVTVHPITSC